MRGCIPLHRQTQRGHKQQRAGSGSLTDILRLHWVAWGWHGVGMRVAFTRQAEGQRPTFRGMMGKIGWAIVHFFFFFWCRFFCFYFQHYCSSFFFSCLFFTDVNPACSFRWRYARVYARVGWSRRGCEVEVRLLQCLVRRESERKENGGCRRHLVARDTFVTCAPPTWF